MTVQSTVMWSETPGRTAMGRNTVMRPLETKMMDDGFSSFNGAIEVFSTEEEVLKNLHVTTTNGFSKSQMMMLINCCPEIINPGGVPDLRRDGDENITVSLITTIVKGRQPLRIRKINTPRHHVRQLYVSWEQKISPDNYFYKTDFDWVSSGQFVGKAVFLENIVDWRQSTHADSTATILVLSRDSGDEEADRMIATLRALTDHHAQRDVADLLTPMKSRDLYNNMCHNWIWDPKFSRPFLSDDAYSWLADALESLRLQTRIPEKFSNEFQWKTKLDELTEMTKTIVKQTATPLPKQDLRQRLNEKRRSSLDNTINISSSSSNSSGVVSEGSSHSSNISPPSSRNFRPVSPPSNLARNIHVSGPAAAELKKMASSTSSKAAARSSFKPEKAFRFGQKTDDQAPCDPRRKTGDAPRKSRWNIEVTKETNPHMLRSMIHKLSTPTPVTAPRRRASTPRNDDEETVENIDKFIKKTENMVDADVSNSLFDDHLLDEEDDEVRLDVTPIDADALLDGTLSTPLAPAATPRRQKKMSPSSLISPVSIRPLTPRREPTLDEVEAEQVLNGTTKVKSKNPIKDNSISPDELDCCKTMRYSLKHHVLTPFISDFLRKSLRSSLRDDHDEFMAQDVALYTPSGCRIHSGHSVTGTKPSEARRTPSKPTEEKVSVILNSLSLLYLLHAGSGRLHQVTPDLADVNHRGSNDVFISNTYRLLSPCRSYQLHAMNPDVMTSSVLFYLLYILIYNLCNFFMLHLANKCMTILLTTFFFLKTSLIYLSSPTSLALQNLRHIFPQNNRNPPEHWVKTVNLLLKCLIISCYSQLQPQSSSVPDELVEYPVRHHPTLLSPLLSQQLHLTSRPRSLLLTFPSEKISSLSDPTEYETPEENEIVTNPPVKMKPIDLFNSSPYLLSSYISSQLYCCDMSPKTMKTFFAVA